MKDGFLGTRFSYKLDDDSATILEQDTLTDIWKEYRLRVSHLREQVMTEALAKLGYKLVKIKEDESAKDSP